MKSNLQVINLNTELFKVNLLLSKLPQTFYLWLHIYTSTVILRKFETKPQ